LQNSFKDNDIALFGGGKVGKEGENENSDISDKKGNCKRQKEKHSPQNFVGKGMEHNKGGMKDISVTNVEYLLQKNEGDYHPQRNRNVYIWQNAIERKEKETSVRNAIKY